MSFPQYRYCPNCRGDLETRRIPAPGGPERRVCADCGFVHWGNSKPTAAGIVLDANGRVLLARRAIEPFHGWWDVPGGFLEPGEHPEDGVRRELREETGCEVVVTRLVGVYMDVYGEDDVGEPTLNFYYECRMTGGEPTAADDVNALHWFAAGALPARIAFPDSAQKALSDWRRAQQENAGKGP